MIEAWSEIYSENDIKKIQKIELNSLDVFEDVCRKLGIRFFLYGGSLLGAVKYKGFVPWDDDLDLAMLRDDYEKLIREGPSILSKKYEIQHPRTERKTPYHYIKFRRRDTALVEYRNHSIKMNHGVYFDIYPIDNLPDDYTLYMKQKLEYDRWVTIFQSRQNYRLDRKVDSAGSMLRLMIRWFQSCVAHIFSVEYLITKIESISTRYNSSVTQNQGNLSFPRPVNYFNGVDYQDAIFEGHNIYIPSGYKVNLKNRYGDIRRTPASNKRIGHRPYILQLDCEEALC